MKLTKEMLMGCALLAAFAVRAVTVTNGVEGVEMDTYGYGTSAANPVVVTNNEDVLRFAYSSVLWNPATVATNTVRATITATRQKQDGEAWVSDGLPMAICDRHGEGSVECIRLTRGMYLMEHVVSNLVAQELIDTTNAWFYVDAEAIVLAIDSRYGMLDTREGIRRVSTPDDLLPLTLSKNAWSNQQDGVRAEVTYKAEHSDGTAGSQGKVASTREGDMNVILLPWDIADWGTNTLTHTVYGPDDTILEEQTATFLVDLDALKYYQFMLPVDFGNGVTNNCIVNWEWIEANLKMNRETNRTDIATRLYKVDKNGIVTWQNYVMGVDGSNEANEFVTVFMRPDGGAATDIVVRTPIDEFKGSAGAGIGVSYQLVNALKPIGDETRVIADRQETPVFPLSLEDVEAGNTVLRINAVFEVR